MYIHIEYITTEYVLYQPWAQCVNKERLVNNDKFIVQAHFIEYVVIDGDIQPRWCIIHYEDWKFGDLIM